MLNLTIYYKDSSFKPVRDVCCIQFFSYDDLLVIEGGPYTAADPLEIFHVSDIVDYVALIPEVIDE